jgi:hypothetical protein
MYQILAVVAASLLLAYQLNYHKATYVFTKPSQPVSLYLLTSLGSGRNVSDRLS